MKINAQEFKTRLAAIHRFCGESSRFAFTCVLLEIKSGKAHLVATDTRRLCAVDLAATDCLSDGQYLIPQRDAKILSEKITSTVRGDVSLSVADGVLTANWIDARRTEREYAVTLGEGRFPDWGWMFPENLPNAITGTAEQFLDLVLPEKRTGVLSLNGKVEIAPKPSCLKFTGDPMAVCYDLDLLGDFFDAVPRESECVMRLLDNESPAMIETGNYRFLMMPIAMD